MLLTEAILNHQPNAALYRQRPLLRDMAVHLNISSVWFMDWFRSDRDWNLRIMIQSRIRGRDHGLIAAYGGNRRNTLYRRFLHYLHDKSGLCGLEWHY